MENKRFLYRHKDKVQIIKVPERFPPNYHRALRIGATGKVLALRDTAGRSQYLVKIEGMRRPISFEQNELKSMNGQASTQRRIKKAQDYFNEFLLDDWKSIDKDLSGDSWFQDQKQGPDPSSDGSSSSMEQQQQDMFSTRPTFDRHKQESKKDRTQRIKDEYNARPYIGVGAGIHKRRQERLAQLVEFDKEVLELRKKKVKDRHPELDDDDLVKVAPDEKELEAEAQINSLQMEIASPCKSQTPVATRKQELAKRIEQLKGKRRNPESNEARPSSVSHDSTITYTNPEGFGQNVASLRGFTKKKAEISKYAAVKASLSQLDQFIERSEDDEYKLPKLPYEYDALEPWIDKETMELHHKKHHKGYVEGLNEALAELKEGEANVKDLMCKIAFNGSGHILHSIFWTSLSAERGNKKPEGTFAEAIDRDFGSFRDMQDQFVEAASSVEGSGWGLLVVEPYTRRLMILQTEKHQNLTVQGSIPIMAIDVWEHAYYLQYKNDRTKYVKAVFDKLLDWEVIAQRYEEIIKKDALQENNVHDEEIENTDKLDDASGDNDAAE